MCDFLYHLPLTFISFEKIETISLLQFLTVFNRTFRSVRSYLALSYHISPHLCNVAGFICRYHVFQISSDNSFIFKSNDELEASRIKNPCICSVTNGNNLIRITIILSIYPSKSEAQIREGFCN